MIREQLVERKIGADQLIRWRGEDVSRLEGISDAVFGFSITLIVVSLDVPKTFDDLVVSLSNVGGFAFSFLTLIGIWFVHYRFFRRYGLEDGWTAILNTLLLFIVLLYIYPLKFLYTLAWHSVIGPMPTDPPMIRIEQVPQLFFVYGVGYVAIYAIFSLMHYNAYRQRIKLALTPIEVLNTIDFVVGNIVTGGVGLLSIAIAAFAGPDQVQWAGWIYATIPLARIVARLGMSRYHHRHSATPATESIHPTKD
jgi:uncharacterized membrane protein